MGQKRKCYHACFTCYLTKNEQQKKVCHLRFHLIKLKKKKENSNKFILSFVYVFGRLFISQSKRNDENQLGILNRKGMYDFFSLVNLKVQKHTLQFGSDNDELNVK